MSSVNKAIILGNVGRDPEVRYAPSGMAICNLSIATTRRTGKGDDRKEETEWHRVTLLDKLAEVAGNFLKKGRQVYIEGRLQTRKWTDKDGIDKYTTEIVAHEMQLLGPREDGAKPAEKPASKPKTGTGFDNMDDDVPW